MDKNIISNSKVKTKTVNYQSEEMALSTCLICGEHVGDYSYRGKSICGDCVKIIRTNY